MAVQLRLRSNIASRVLGINIEHHHSTNWDKKYISIDTGIECVCPASHSSFHIYWLPIQVMPLNWSCIYPFPPWPWYQSVPILSTSTSTSTGTCCLPRVEDVQDNTLMYLWYVSMPFEVIHIFDGQDEGMSVCSSPVISDMPLFQTHRGSRCSSRSWMAYLGKFICYWT